MTHNGSNRLYIGMAPLYYGLAVERVVVQGIKFALNHLKSIIGIVNFVLEVDSARDSKKLFTIALTAAEYHLNFIRFSLSPSIGLVSPTIDAIKLAQFNTTELEKRLASLGPLSVESEARARRTETCFRDILLSLEEWRQLRDDGSKRTKRARTGAQVNEFLEPMLKSSNIFESEAEKFFMLSLRHLHLRAGVLSPMETLQELENLCQLLRSDTITLSEVMTDTALRSVNIILVKMRNQIFQDDASNGSFPPNICNNLKSCFLDMNRPANLQWKEENCVGYKNYVQNRERSIISELLTINSVLIVLAHRQAVTAPPTMEAAPNVPSSALWQRLQSVESVATLTEGKEEEECAICREVVFFRDDFGILSSCSHLFCVRCIEEWFKTKSTCPICRALTSSWTTKKHFEDLKNHSQIVGDTKQPVKRQSRN